MRYGVAWILIYLSHKLYLWSMGTHSNNYASWLKSQKMCMCFYLSGFVWLFYHWNHRKCIHVFIYQALFGSSITDMRQNVDAFSPSRLRLVVLALKSLKMCECFNCSISIYKKVHFISNEIFILWFLTWCPWYAAMWLHSLPTKSRNKGWLRTTFPRILFMTLLIQCWAQNCRTHRQANSPLQNVTFFIKDIKLSESCWGECVCVVGACVCVCACVHVCVWGGLPVCGCGTSSLPFPFKQSTKHYMSQVEKYTKSSPCTWLMLIP